MNVLCLITFSTSIHKKPFTALKFRIEITSRLYSYIPAASFFAEAGELAAFLGDMTLCSAAAFLALLVFTEELDGDLGVWIDDQNNELT